jgi:hypothetical protein
MIPFKEGKEPSPKCQGRHEEKEIYNTLRCMGAVGRVEWNTSHIREP